MADKKQTPAQVANSSTELVINNAFIDGMVAQLKEKEKYGLTFPKGYNYQNELLGAYLVLKETTDANKKPVLQSCTQASIANTLMDMVTLGLSMQKKQCYPVAYAGKLQLQTSVYGNTCIARQFGMDDIEAICIYEGDDFAYHIENAKIVIDHHYQSFVDINPEKIIGAYAVVTFINGKNHVELMNLNMIKQAWKQGYGYKEDGKGTHQKFTDQMAIKTVKNRALKYTIRTYGTQHALDAYEHAEKDIHSAEVIEADVAHDIQQNANTEEFIPVVDAEVVEAEVVETELPEFMSAE